MELLTYPNKKDRDYFILQAVFGTVVVNLIFTVFLTGIFIHFNTPDGIMGYIPILPNIAGILLIFAGIITENIRNIKRAVILLNFIGKSFLLLIVWIPLFINNEYTPYIMLIMAFLGFLSNALMSILINNWFVEIIDEKIRGRYMSVRQMFSLLVSATIPIISGRFLDLSTDKYVAFCIIFSLGWFFSHLESFALSKIRVPIKESHEFKKIKFLDMFNKPFKNKKFMKFIYLMIFFHMVWFFSMTFASVYQLKYMQISYTYLNVMMAVGAIIQIFIYPMVGKMIDQYGSKLVMRIAFFFFMTHGILYFFMINSNAYFIYFLLNINGAFLNPTWILSTFNERFKLIPKKGRTLYDGFYMAIIGVSIFAGPFFGNLARKNIIKFQISNFEYPEFRLLFLLTSLILIVLNIVLFIKSKNNKNDEYEQFKITKLFKK